MPSDEKYSLGGHSGAASRVHARYFGTLRGRITIVSVAALVLVTLAMVVSGQSAQKRIFHEFSAAKRASDRLMFEKVVSYQLAELEERLTHIVSPPLVKALREGNLATLREYALPPFNRLSSLINMNRLAFYRTADTPFYVAHDDTGAQARQGAPTLVSEAFSRRAIRTGLDRYDGQIVLSVAWPVYSDGAMVGVVAVGGEMKPILEELKRTLGAELALVTREADQSLQVTVHTGDILAASSLGLVTSAVQTAAADEVGTHVTKDRDGRHWETHVSAVPGPGQSGLGWLWVGRDASALTKSLMQNTIVDILIASTVTAAALALILFNVARVFGGLDRMVTAIQDFSAGKWDVTIPPSQDNEVGRLGDALQQMVRNVGETHSRLEQSEREAKAASTAKSMFIANMSHELRTPLNAILGYADLLRDDLASHGMERNVADMTRIHDAARSLLSIINDLLDIAKLDSGKLQVESAPVRVGALVRELEHELGDQVRRNGNEFTVQLDQPDANVLGDPARLKQALRNVLQNAGKFTHQGKVQFSVRSDDASPGKISFIIADTGIGMPAEALPHLFQPFSQVDGSTTRKFGGLGIGLAISRALCELMGGSLKLDTRPGAGTTVTIMLPRAQRVTARNMGSTA